MKRYISILGILAVAIGAYSCDSQTYEDLQDEPVIEGPVTYNGQVKAIIDNNCIVCHSPGGLSSFRPLTTYAEVKDAVQTTNLLDRIQRMNGEQGAMPQTGRMSQGNIDVILEWEMDGLLEN